MALLSRRRPYRIIISIQRAANLSLVTPLWRQVIPLTSSHEQQTKRLDWFTFPLKLVIVNLSKFYIHIYMCV